MAVLQNYAFTGNKITETVTTTSKVSKSVVSGGKVVATLTAEPFNGKATLQYDGVIRSLFKDGRTIHPMSEDRCYTDTALTANAYISGASYTFCRGVGQLGEAEVMPYWKFATKMPRFRWYKGYEFGVVFAVMNYKGDYWDVCLDGSDIDQRGDHYSIEEGVFFYDLTTSPFGEKLQGLLTLETEENTMDSRTVEACEVPEHPFYVRWVNNQGGYDYHMFACRQTVKKSLTSSSSFQPYSANGESRSFNKEAKKVVEVSTGLIDAATMEALMEMPMSPDIRVYKKDTQEWVSVEVETSDWSVKSDQPTGELVFSFLMPGIKVSF